MPVTKSDLIDSIADKLHLAKARAEQIATTLGVTLGSPVSAVELSVSSLVPAFDSPQRPLAADAAARVRAAGLLPAV